MNAGFKINQKVTNTKKVIKIKQTKKLPEMANKTINTMIGLAIYICTEFEDENGNFNDDYYTSSGYFLIHQGDKHHVYKV